jgi:hypothetical protein
VGPINIGFIRSPPPPPQLTFRINIVYEKNSAFIISDLVSTIKEKNMILNVHYHCSTLHKKYEPKEIHIRIQNV